MPLNTEEALSKAEAEAAASATAVADPLVKVITFTWGTELYAVPLADTREVAKITTITPVPGLPPALLGAMNLRGDILPVVNARVLLGLEQGQISPTARLIIVAHAVEMVGLLVDSIGDVLEVPATGRQVAPSDLIARQEVLHDGRLLNVLDLRRVLSALVDS